MAARQLGRLVRSLAVDLSGTVSSLSRGTVSTYSTATTLSTVSIQRMESLAVSGSGCSLAELVFNPPSQSCNGNHSTGNGSTSSSNNNNKADNAAFEVGPMKHPLLLHRYSKADQRTPYLLVCCILLRSEENLTIYIIIIFKIFINHIIKSYVCSYLNLIFDLLCAYFEHI